MLIVFYSLLMLRVGRCTDDLNFEMKTVEVGHDVTLTCARHKFLHQTQLFWIRLVSGNMPELLGGTFTFDFDGVNKTPRITAKQGNGTFFLRISGAQLSDTGLYYCVTVKSLDMTFVEGTFLRIQGPEPDVTAITQDSPSDPVRPGNSVTLQCSVLYDSQNKTCPGDHSVFWFRAGSESNPSFIYAHGNSGAECETILEARSPQKCVYSFSKNVSSSDAGTYYCAVATCGEILFGNGTKLDVEALWDLRTANIVVFLLCAAVVISLIVISYLSYTTKKKSCGCCNGSRSFSYFNPSNSILQKDAVVERNASGGQQSQQRDEDLLTHSAPTFTKRKPCKANRKMVKPAEAPTTYSDIRTFVID